MRKLCIFNIAVFYCLQVLGQTADRNAFNVDRPDVTESPFTVQPLSFQFENGFDLLRDKSQYEFQIPNIMFRTGLYKSGELRLAVQHGIRRTRINTTVMNLTDYYIVGYKQTLFRQTKVIPSIALLGNFAFVDQIDFGTDAYEGDLIAAFQNDFNENSMLGYNIGIEKKGLSNEFNFLSSVSYSYQYHHKSSFYLEYYNVLGNQVSEEHGFDGGMTYLCGKKFLIDFLIGYNLNRTFFCSTGFSFRLDFNQLK